MTLLHLTLLDHAVAAAAEALRILRTEHTRKQRDAFRLSGAVHQTHLAVEKLLKHAIAEVDPMLLLRDPKPGFLRSLRKEIIRQHLPSILASRQKLDSLNAEGAWEVLVDVLEPALDIATRDAFKQALGALTNLRNRVQHAELYEDDEEVMSALRRLLSKLPMVSTAIAPDFLSVLEERHKGLYAELRGIERAVTGAWWLLEELLNAKRSISIPFTLYVTLRPNVPTIEVVFLGPEMVSGTLGILADRRKPALRLLTELEKESVSGLFSRELTTAAAQSRDSARREVIRKKLALESAAVPASSGDESAVKAVSLIAPPNQTSFLNVRALSGLDPADRLPFDAIVGSLLSSSASFTHVREHEYIERYGMPPLEAGGLTIEMTPAWVQAPTEAGPVIAGDVIIERLAIALEADQDRGTLSGTMLPPRVDPSQSPRAISLEGEVWLMDELVVAELSTSVQDPLPVGTVVRHLKGELHVLAGSVEQVQ